jgi:hypothetical protein
MSSTFRPSSEFTSLQEFKKKQLIDTNPSIDFQTVLSQDCTIEGTSGQMASVLDLKNQHQNSKGKTATPAPQLAKQISNTCLANKGNAQSQRPGSTAKGRVFNNGSTNTAANSILIMKKANI